MKISEKTVSYIWERQLVDGLKTVDGQPVEVCYPGRPSGKGGCDFCDAVFYFDNKQVWGNVEVHVKSSHWYCHNHHKDPNYNRVSLHVVMWHDCSGPTILQNGNRVPTIELASFLKVPLEEKAIHSVQSKESVGFLCEPVNRFSDSDRIIGILDRAGEKRFMLKSAIFSGELDEGQKAENVLLKYIAMALGYMNNVEPFEKLCRVTLYEMFKKHSCADVLSMQSAIVGTAGLLPSQRTAMSGCSCNDGTLYINELEAIWKSFGFRNTMSDWEWQLRSQRPQNHPVRRQVALAYLLDRYRDGGIVDSLARIITGATGERPWTGLRKALQVASTGYWNDHIDFGITFKHHAALIGAERAGEIAVNVVLPFIFAWAGMYHNRQLQESAVTLYRQFPHMEENHITRHMKEQLLHGNHVILNAAQQQGLIHIYRTHCRYRDCMNCMVYEM